MRFVVFFVFLLLATLIITIGIVVDSKNSYKHIEEMERLKLKQKMVENNPNMCFDENFAK